MAMAFGVRHRSRRSLAAARAWHGRFHRQRHASRIEQRSIREHRLGCLGIVHHAGDHPVPCAPVQVSAGTVHKIQATVCRLHTGGTAAGVDRAEERTTPLRARRVPVLTSAHRYPAREMRTLVAVHQAGHLLAAEDVFHHSSVPRSRSPRVRRNTPVSVRHCRVLRRRHRGVRVATAAELRVRLLPSLRGRMGSLSLPAIGSGEPRAPPGGCVDGRRVVAHPRAPEGPRAFIDYRTELA